MNRLAFVCQRCNQCCQGRGGIHLSDQELPRAAALLGITPAAFARRYCRRVDGRWEILTNRQGACRLLGPQGCLIHGAKPAICRRWPFFEALLKDPGAFEEAKLSCPGLGPQATHEQFLAQYRATLAQEDDKP